MITLVSPRNFIRILKLDQLENTLLFINPLKFVGQTNNVRILLSLRLDFVFLVFDLLHLHQCLFLSVLAEIDVVLFEFNLSFPASPNRLVLSFLDFELLVQRVDLGLQLFTFSLEFIHFSACEVSVLLHFLFDGTNFEHVFIDFSLLAS